QYASPEGHAGGPPHIQGREAEEKPARGQFKRSYSTGGVGSTSSNLWASNSRQNAGNMISDRPSCRVSRPPGGFSSIHIG
ncbi:unnamed protein product, partial [Chrysoparadoxa australica]